MGFSLDWLIPYAITAAQEPVGIDALNILLPQLISFFAGISCGLAFVSATRMRWF